jgi:hypothetical protein
MTFCKNTYNMAHSTFKINSAPELNIRAITEFIFMSTPLKLLSFEFNPYVFVQK